MQEKRYIFTCTGVCWVVGMCFGLLFALMLGLGLLLGLIVAVVAGCGAALALQWAFCRQGAAHHGAGVATPAIAQKAPAQSGRVTSGASDDVGQTVAAGPTGSQADHAMPATAAKAVTPPVSVPEPDAARPPVAADGKPNLLPMPRGGVADNLKEIKGVGPKLEAVLHKLGVFHFDQIASWRAEEVAWVDENLEGFKGRVTRDDWVAQATTLAQGGKTEFAARVQKGGVY